MRSTALKQMDARHRRITFLHGSNDLYGASKVLVNDATLLALQGHDVSVVLPEHGPLDVLLGRAGVSVFIEPLYAFRRVSPWNSRIPIKLPRSVVTADLVVVWTLALATYLPTLRARRLQTVCSVHEILLGGAGSALAKLATALSTAMMVNSRATQRWVERHSARQVGIELAYPVAPVYDPLPFAPSSSGLRALLAGRVNGHKGHIEAVRAGRAARARGLDLQLTLVGGSYPGQEHHLSLLKAEIREANWVTYYGEVSDIRPQLRPCDVMLVPTTRPEPFGIVALEAWAAGRRVIASDEGGLAEAAAMVNGILVKPRNEEALAEAMIDIATNAEMRSAPPATARASTECTLAHREDAWTRTLAYLDCVS